MVRAKGKDTTAAEDQVVRIPLSQLLLDSNNARFGAIDRLRVNQTEILDYIVATFGVDDVLSSLAVNGYFAAEPIVCRKQVDTDKYVVKEGNRRLAACLILSDDERASNQRDRAQRFRDIHSEHGSPPIDPVPIIRYMEDADNKAILSYLGVRHIASAQAWDSYAKAVWIGTVVHETDLTTQDVAVMIGDQHRTVARLLEGLNFINQLIVAGRFQPDNSIRKGRGSNTSYPFSWVYTILGYSAVRSFLAIEDEPHTTDPIPAARVDDATLLTVAMFGDRSKGQSSAVDDSRQLTDLASAVASPEKVELLRAGKTLSEIKLISQPLDERLGSGLLVTRDILGDLNNRLVEQAPSAAIALRHRDQSSRVRKLANEVDRKLQESADGSGG